MNKKFIIAIGLLIMFAFIITHSNNELFSADGRDVVNTASLLNWSSNSDTSDMRISDLKKEIESLKKEIKELKKNRFGFHFDSDEFKVHMDSLTENLHKFKDWDFHFDSEAFEENMQQLRENLKNKKLVWKDFHFNMEDFEENMKELKEELKDMHLNFKFDSESFEKEMNELCENLEQHKFIFDDFHFDMGNFEMKMENLKVEMNKLESFMKDMRDELKKDGLIEEDEEDFDLILNEDEMKVNGEEVSNELYQKYLDIYEDHFGHKPDHCFKIHSH